MRGTRASYKISRLEVIFMGPWAGAEPALPSLVLFPAGKSTNKFISRLKVIFMAPWGPGAGLPFLYPLTRLVGRHCFCGVAPYRNGLPGRGDLPRPRGRLIRCLRNREQLVEDVSAKGQRLAPFGASEKELLPRGGPLGPFRWVGSLKSIT